MSSFPLRWSALFLSLAFAACGGDDSSSSASGGGGTGGGGTGGGGAGADAGGCVREPGPADAVRKLVLAHPYDANSAKSGRFEVYDVDTSGAITKTGTTFEMGRAATGEIVFTPDGKLGFVATEAGGLGVFRVEASGAVTVLHEELMGSFYAGKLVMDPSGDRLWVLDGEWRDIGGGVYSVSIGCDDVVKDEGLVAAAKLPAAFALLSKTPGRALLAADDVLTSPENMSVHLLDWSATPSVVASESVFPSDDAIVSSMGVTVDEKYALIADNSGFSSVPNRVAVVELGAGTLKPLNVVSPIEDPADIETSPFDNTALVTSGFGNALFVLTFDAGKPTAPYAAQKLTASSQVELPVDMVQVRRGKLQGSVFVGEVSAIRRVTFSSTGAPTDQGTFALGAGTENTAGAIGIQP